MRELGGLVSIADKDRENERRKIRIARTPLLRVVSSGAAASLPLVIVSLSLSRVLCLSSLLRAVLSAQVEETAQRAPSFDRNTF